MVSKIKRSQKILAFALILALANLFSLPNQGNAETVNALAGTVDKAQLERELQALEKQIADYEAQLTTTRSEKNTLAAKVKELKTEQSKLSLQIRSTNLMIGDLEDQIDTTQNSISDLEKKIDTIKVQIGGTIISIYEQDNKSIVSALANDDGLSGFFKEVDNNQQLSRSLSQSLEQIKVYKTDLEDKTVQLEDKQQDARDLLAIKALQQQDLGGKLSEQNSLLSETQGKESQYAALVTANKQRATQIRNQIYDVAGVSREITFGEAVEMAKSASDLTGVRASFLLAILTQESNLGKNVGTCNRAGDPPEKSYTEIMHPTRDIPKFLEITSDLGLDPNTTPVSCPMRGKNGARIGWGGAMGPAQFIPSTWMGYKDKVAAITGKSANPWDIKDAFLAAAIKLKASGAADQNKEWAAAMIYFSGSTNKRYRFYGDNVVATANKYQASIDALN
ncbi:MAG: hypothetical protein ACYC5G_01955 [Candidatus Doudnabacteria bacterium]